MKEIDQKETNKVIITLKDIRGFLWSLCKYRANPAFAPEATIKQLFDINNLERLFFELDGILSDLGIKSIGRLE